MGRSEVAVGGKGTAGRRRKPTDRGQRRSRPSNLPSDQRTRSARPQAAHAQGILRGISSTGWRPDASRMEKLKFPGSPSNGNNDLRTLRPCSAGRKTEAHSRGNGVLPVQGAGTISEAERRDGEETLAGGGSDGNPWGQPKVRDNACTIPGGANGAKHLRTIAATRIALRVDRQTGK